MLEEDDRMLPSLLSTATSFVEFWKVYVAEMSLMHTEGNRAEKQSKRGDTDQSSAYGWSGGAAVCCATYSRKARLMRV